jgi:hypothetical protein
MTMAIAMARRDGDGGCRVEVEIKGLDGGYPVVMVVVES